MFAAAELVLILREVLSRKSLYREAHIHYLRGVTVASRKVDKSALRDNKYGLAVL